MDIVRTLGLPLEERRLSLAEFHTADEVFTTGTMGELTPVYEIDGRRIGSGSTGSGSSGGGAGAGAGVSSGSSSGSSSSDNLGDGVSITQRIQAKYKELTCTSGYKLL
jgi:hypothetical protein